MITVMHKGRVYFLSIHLESDGLRKTIIVSIFLYIISYLIVLYKIHMIMLY